MKFGLRQVAEFLGLPASTDADAMVTGWSVDSRSLLPGDLFLALRGPNHNGHDYIRGVFRKGAAAVVVDQEIPDGQAPPGRVLRVADALQGLQQLASRARQSWGGRVVAVTGSAGKTTTKDIVAEMLGESFNTAKNEGNLNNHVGLPLSLLRFDENAGLAVLEMGMNHAGEIRRLAEIARPETGVVTNVGWAHIEEFDSIEGIAAAKRELIEALPAEGTAVLNADDPRVVRFAKWRAGFSPREAFVSLSGSGAEAPRGLKPALQGAAVLYGQSPEADVRAEDVEHSRGHRGCRRIWNSARSADSARQKNICWKNAWRTLPSRGRFGV